MNASLVEHIIELQAERDTLKKRVESVSGSLERCDQARTDALADVSKLKKRAEELEAQIVEDQKDFQRRP